MSQITLQLGPAPVCTLDVPPDVPLRVAVARIRRWLHGHAHGNAWRLRLHTGNTRRTTTARNAAQRGTSRVRTWQRRQLPTCRPLPPDWPAHLHACLAAPLPPSQRRPFQWLTEAASRPNRFGGPLEAGNERRLPARRIPQPNS